MRREGSLVRDGPERGKRGCMMNVKEQSESRFGNVFTVVLVGVTLLLSTVIISEGRPWFVTGMALFFACASFVLYICIDLILARLGSGIPLENLRVSLFMYFVILPSNVSSAVNFIQKYPSVERDDVVCLLVSLVSTAALMGMFSYITLQVLKTNKRLLPTPTQQIEPSVESSPPQ